MEIIGNIRRTKKMQRQIEFIEKAAEKMKKETISKYNENPCNHDIIIKFYESSYHESCEEPTYQCLGCEKIITDEMELIDKNIVNFTLNKTGSIMVEGKRLLISYLQYLAKETKVKNPNYTDEDFINLLHNQATKIKVPKDFKPSNVKW